MTELDLDLLLSSEDILTNYIDAEMRGWCGTCAAPISDCECIGPKERPIRRNCWPHSGDECARGCPIGVYCPQWVEEEA